MKVLGALACLLAACRDGSPPVAPAPAPAPVVTSDVATPRAPTVLPDAGATAPLIAAFDSASTATAQSLAIRPETDAWNQMVVAAGRVYFTTHRQSGAGDVETLWSVPSGGGRLERHAALRGFAYLAADDTHLYVATNRDLSTMGTPRASLITGNLARMALDGGPLTTLLGNIDPRLIAVNGDFVYFDDSRGFWRVAKDGAGTPRVVAPAGVLSVAFDDTFIYASRIVHGGEVSRFPKAGGAARIIATALPDEISVAVDETHAYLGGATWLPRSTRGRGLVARVPKGGGKMDVVARGRDAARDIFLDATHVYWGEGRSGYAGRVMRAPKGGGPLEVVHEDSTFERAVSDGTWIYVMSDGTFAERSTGVVERLADAALWRFPKAGSLPR